MKKFVFSFALLLWLCIEPGAVLAETNLAPVVTLLVGKVTVVPSGGAAFSATDHQAVPVGSQVTTVGTSSVLLSLAPGINAKLKGKTAIRLKTAQVSSSNRNAELDLVRGIVLCHVKKQGTQKQKYRVDIGSKESMEAGDAMWQASVYDDRHSVATLSGSVLWTYLPDPGPIAVPAGSVLISEYETRQGDQVLVGVKLINLVAGTYTVYGSGGDPPVTMSATADQLNVARTVFTEALGDQFANLGSTDHTPLTSMLFDANHTLTLVGLPPLTTPPANTGAVANTVTSANPVEATSPITP